MNIDLHVHTTESDGSLSVSEVLDLASEKKIRILALTDHETTNGLPEAIRRGKELGIQVIPGVELMTGFQGREVHLLGYFTKEALNDHSLQERLKELRFKRTALAYDMVKTLQRDGFTLKWTDVENVAGPDGAVSKGHIMRALYDHENGNIHWSTIAGFFQPNGNVYLPFLEHPFEEAVDMIFELGGVPVLAHPGLLKDPHMVHDLLAFRRIGLEVYYGYWENRERLIAEFESLAHEKALFSTGGSDFHGLFGPVKLGGISVPKECVEQLFKYLGKAL